MVKKHLISGITGQDGIFLTSYILKNNKNDLVYGISRNQNKENFEKRIIHTLGDSKKINNLKIINVDITNENDTSKIIYEIKPNYLYNLSGPSSVYKSMLDGGATHNQIIQIFNNLINPIIKENLKCNIFQASSSEMFDLSSDPLDEKSNFNPRSPYAEAKLHLHRHIEEVKTDHKINISSGIMFNHESEFRDDEYLIMKIINSAISINKKKKGKLKVGSLNLVRDRSYAKDIAKAIYLINMENGSEDYVIGSGIGNNVKNILKIVFEYYDLNWEDFVIVD